MTMTIDEALNRAEAMNAGLDWILLSQYGVRAEYASPEVSIDLDNRVIGDLSENVSTEGENNAEYISFIMDRYHDGVDLSNMLIQIQYELEDGSGSIDGVVNAYMNDDQIKFGWVVPPAAAQVDAVIKLMVFCTGTLGANTYTLKTLPMEYTIHSTLETGGFIPQPDENWYLQFANTMQQNVLAAKASADAAAQSASDANDDLADIKAIQSDVNSSKSTVQTLTAQVQSNTTKAQTSAAAAKVSEQNAEASEVKAKMYAENAEAVTGVGIASQKKAGLVKGGENYIDESGELQLTKRTTSPTLYNSYAGGIKLNELGGVSEQDSTTGYNLLDCRGLVEQTVGNVTFTPVYDANGNLEYVEANGTLSTLSEYRLCSNYPLPNGTYILSGANASNKKIFVNYGSIWATDVGNGVKFGITDSSKVSVVIQIETGVTCDNIRFYPMIRLASVTDATYEPYTGGQPSPNPEYPQEINSVEVSGFWGHGKNFLNPSTDKMTNLTYADGVYTSSPSGVYAMLQIYMVNKIKVYASKKYYLKVKVRRVSGTGEINTVSLHPLKRSAWISKPNITAEFQEYIAELYIDSDSVLDTICVVQPDTTADNIVLEIKDVILCENLDDTYEPYTEQSHTLSNPIKLNGVGTAQDKFVRKDGVWKIERNIGEAVFDGSDDEVINSAGTSTSGKNRFALSLPSIKSTNNADIANILCNKLIPKTFNQVWGCTQGIAASTDGTYVHIYIDEVAEYTVEQFREWLAENPIAVQYEAAQPTYEDLPAADQIALNSLVSYDGITYLYCDSEVQPTWDLEYGTSRVGGYTLECYNDKEIMKIEVAAMKAAQTTTEEVTE